ncbi:GntR family transcriptional regulator [Listeria booriae]|uniref:GntR family transcriptional regulator n=1 Tax=Listeria booriae TaxID=1552123 RepID=UPI00162786E0|nr:GntR family transcriptional regulator [Listeria booriae]MBC2159789.1 GntR family transcriptional regulator [Listeria booriae]MBC2162119.1 GntR family transcriptional regulator [Listeria booriae]MBC2170260.1 GntR family transcriptional regulator [Listeria booriae]MBC2173039.1 GntR family transcriptional regulator [Listeria booriae]MBC2195353.1 GntR family transcriptional regulator [Listeria booriae]
MERKKKRLEETAYDYILFRIISGEYTFGDFINQRELTDELNMSRTPIRSALSQLAGEGYVRMLPYNGTFVAYKPNMMINGEDS